MNKSLKIGAIAGLIAGIVFGIAHEVFNQIAVSLGLYLPYWRPFVINNITVNIPLFGFWGIVLGIIYSRIYDIIPRKNIIKGVIYGLFLYFIIAFRIGTFDLAYGLLLDVAGGNFSGFFSWLSFGLVISILYESLHEKYNIPKEKKKIITYNIESGILPGALAGFCGGLVASVSQVIGHITGYWGLPTASGELVSTIEFWWS